MLGHLGQATITEFSQKMTKNMTLKRHLNTFKRRHFGKLLAKYNFINYSLFYFLFQNPCKIHVYFLTIAIV